MNQEMEAALQISEIKIILLNVAFVYLTEELL